MKDNKYIKEMQIIFENDDVKLKVLFKDDKLNNKNVYENKFYNMLQLIKHLFPRYSNYIDYDYQYTLKTAVGSKVYPLSVNTFLAKFLIFNDFIYYKTKDDIIDTIDKVSEFIKDVQNNYDALINKFNKS